MSCRTHREKKSDLLALQQGVEYETGIGECVAWYRMRLLHAASIGHTGLTHVGVTNVVTGPISSTILVFRADVRGRGVRKIVVDCQTCHEQCFPQAGRSGRTNLDELILEFGYFVLQNTIRVF